MIRTIALGAVCLACLGAIAAAAKKPALPQPAEIAYPAVAGSKADRLPLIARLDTPTVLERVDVAYVPPVEIPPEPAAPQKATSPPLARIVSRHWHDPHDREVFLATKKKAREGKTRRSADRERGRTIDATKCRSDGWDPLMRKLNLSPQCR